jgi:phage tail sheath protein FI
MPTYLSPGVYVEEVPAATRPIAGVGTAIAGFIGFAPSGPLNTPTMVTTWQQYVAAFGEFTEEFALAKAVYGYFNNGGGRAYIVRVPYPGDGNAPSPALPTGQLEVSGSKATPALNVRAQDANSDPISVEVLAPSSDSAPAGSFDVEVKVGDDVVENYSSVTLGAGNSNVATVVNTASKLIRIEEQTLTADLIKAGIDPTTLTLAVPSDLAIVEIDASSVIGDTAQRTGFSGFEMHEEITMVAAPDLAVAHRNGLVDLDGFKAVQSALITHCELMGNRMAILDSPAGMNAQEVSDWRMNTTGYDSKFAALYWPWINMLDPAVGHNVVFPPSGHVAGLWASNDSSRGVFKAPANEVLQGALGIEVNATRGEMDLLNPQGVNTIKAFPGRGVRVWGARTLSSDAEWRYINVRRYFNYLEESILQGTQWCVFEPNDDKLWGRIRRTISAFLVNEWRSGALFGAKAEQAFFVTCDGTNNTAESIDAGMVVVDIAVAPVKPAEFIVFRLAQFSGGSSISD